MTCVSGLRAENTHTGRLSHRPARTVTSPIICHCGTWWPERPTWVTDWMRASCIAPRLTSPMAAHHGSSQRHVDLGPQDGSHHQRADNVSGREERRQLGARDQLDVLEGRAFTFAAATGQAERLPSRKPGRDHPFVAIRCFVHPPAVIRVTSGVTKERLRAVKGRESGTRHKSLDCASLTAKLELIELADDGWMIERP